MALGFRAYSTTADSAANVALTQTISGVTGYCHYVYGFSVAISGAAVSATMTVLLKDGTTSIYKDIIGVGAPVGERIKLIFEYPIRITSGADLVLSVSAGGASCVATGNVFYITEVG